MNDLVGNGVTVQSQLRPELGFIRVTGIGVNRSAQGGDDLQVHLGRFRLGDHKSLVGQGNLGSRIGYGAGDPGAVIDGRPVLINTTGEGGQCQTGGVRLCRGCNHPVTGRVEAKVDHHSSHAVSILAGNLCPDLVITGAVFRYDLDLW